YELLTGSIPLRHQRLKQATYAEIIRMVKEEEPPKPSTRLSELASHHAPRDEHVTRSVTATLKLAKFVRGELDWIVMKCLEKDRNRRYESASAFAADVQRYLADEPVQACPPSVGYRLRKFVRRHKGTVTAAAAILALLLAGTAVSTWQAVRATRAERQTGEALDQVTAE